MPKKTTSYTVVTKSTKAAMTGVLSSSVGIENSKVEDSKESNKNPYVGSPYVLTCIKYHGVSWDHSATIVGRIEDVTKENYCSVYPQSEQEPEFLGDPDDLSSQILVVMTNLKRIFFTTMSFEGPGELTKYPHDMVQIPLTKEQFEEASAVVRAEKLRAEHQIVKYSVIPTDSTYSCAGHQHLLLDCIAQGEERSHLSFASRIWPTASFKIAEKIAAARLDDERDTTSPSTPPLTPCEQYSPKVSEKSIFSVRRMAEYFAEAQEYKKERHGSFR